MKVFRMIPPNCTEMKNESNRKRLFPGQRFKHYHKTYVRVGNSSTARISIGSDIDVDMTSSCAMGST